MSHSYNPEELEKLQVTLYQILSEIKRVCDKHGIKYFITGGTAIGAYFWGKFLPWDDDVDVGMPRSDYERFAKIAQEEMGEDYFLQTPHTDPHVPFFFMKVRMNGTEFNENTFQHIKMHQGIYVDIFPFDKIPNSNMLGITHEEDDLTAFLVGWIDEIRPDARKFLQETDGMR